MKPKVHLFVETGIQTEKAVTFANDTEIDGNDVSVYLDKERALLAIAMLASTLGVEVIIDGKEVEIVL